MRLRTFESFWLLKNGLLYSYPSAQKTTSAEIIVLGGGITGALISHALVQEGYKTILLDKRDIGMGSTSATTSMLQYEIDVPLYRLSKKIGENAAAACYKAGIAAINELAQLISKEKIDCGFQKKKSLYIAHTKKSAEWLFQEYEARAKHQLGVTWTGRQAILDQFGISSHGGILSNCAGSVDAYKLAHELIQKNTQRGLRVYDQVDISKIKHTNKGVSIILKNKCAVHAKKIIYCTGFETTEMLKEKIADLKGTYACVSEQKIRINTRLNNLLVWNTRDPYLYLRTTDDGRLLVGGADSDRSSATYLERTKDIKSKELMKQLRELIPGINFIEDFTWAGVFGSTKDGLPYIGTHPDYKNGLFVLGFGGNGITFSVQGMKIVIDMLTDKPNEISEYYKFGR